jgi:hypothetical protein
MRIYYLWIVELSSPHCPIYADNDKAIADGLRHSKAAAPRTQGISSQKKPAGEGGLTGQTRA